MRPQLHLFDSSQIDAIINDALATLQSVGVLVENEAALALLQEGGVRLDQGRVYFPESMVRQALGTAPQEVLVYDRDGAEALHLGGDAIHFDPGSAALYMLDPETGRRRTGTARGLRPPGLGHRGVQARGGPVHGHRAGGHATSGWLIATGCTWR